MVPRGTGRLSRLLSARLAPRLTPGDRVEWLGESGTVLDVPFQPEDGWHTIVLDGDDYAIRVAPGEVTKLKAQEGSNG